MEPQVTVNIPGTNINIPLSSLGGTPIGATGVCNQGTITFPCANLTIPSSQSQTSTPNQLLLAALSGSNSSVPTSVPSNQVSPLNISATNVNANQSNTSSNEKTTKESGSQNASASVKTEPKPTQNNDTQGW